MTSSATPSTPSSSTPSSSATPRPRGARFVPTTSWDEVRPPAATRQPSAV